MVSSPIAWQCLGEVQHNNQFINEVVRISHFWNPIGGKSSFVAALFDLNTFSRTPRPSAGHVIPNLEGHMLPATGWALGIHD
jgi:hypothetical protein